MAILQRSDVVDSADFVAKKLRWQLYLLRDTSLSTSARLLGALITHDFDDRKGGYAWRAQGSRATPKVALDQREAAPAEPQDTYHVRTGLDPRTIQLAVKELEAAGWLRVERGRGRGHTNHYWACLEKAVLPAPLNADQSGSGAPTNAESTGPTPPIAHEMAGSEPPFGAEMAVNSATKGGKNTAQLLQDSDISEPEEGSSGDELFETLHAAFADKDPHGTRRGPSKAAWDRVTQDVSPERLLAAGLRYIRESPDVRRGQTTWLHVWLADRDRWENLLPRERAPQVGAAMEEFARSSSSPVPPEIRAAVVTHLGEAFGHGENFARSYLDPASWDPETKTVRLRTQTAGRRFREERITAMLLSTLGVSVVDGSEPQGSAQATSQAGEVEA